MPDAIAAVLLALDEQRVEHRAAVVDGDVADDARPRRCRGRPRRRRCGRRTGTWRRPGRSRRRRRARRACRRRRRSSSVSATRRASSPHDSAPAGTPATPTVPASVSTTMSATSASSRWAASRLALSTSASVALCTADPPSCSEREPPVPPPVGTRSVSPSTRRMRSIGMPVWSLTIMANAVWWPWPWAERAGEHVGRAVVVDLDGAPLLGPAAGGDLDVGGDADAEQRARRRWPAARPAPCAGRRSRSPRPPRRAACV